MSEGPQLTDESKITAYHNIFEEKLKKLVKDIKKLRKDPSAVDHMKKLLEEARRLKKLLKKERKKPICHTIEIALDTQSHLVTIKEASASHAIRVLDARCVGGLLIVEFETKTLPL